MAELKVVKARDLVGCRYRVVQRERFPDVPPTPSGLARLERYDAARSAVHALLPTKRAVGDRGPFSRVIAGSFFATLEAMAAEATLILDAHLEWGDFEVFVDILVRIDGGYVPVIISNHRVARPASGSSALAVATSRLGLGTFVEVSYRMRHHSADSYALALATRALATVGQDTGLGGVIGQDRSRCFIEPVAVFNQALSDALAVPVPEGPRRLKECDSCRFWFDCSATLTAADDLSLLLPGERSTPYRERGINTIQQLIDANLGEPSVLATAYRSGTVLVPRGELSAPRRDVEVDIDMEAYLDQGAYLWGLLSADGYEAFAAWTLADEAANFAAFWAALMGHRTAARAAGLSFGAYCYSNHGENHWMLQSARRFAGFSGVPTEEEVQDFIASEDWIDVFALVRAQLIGPFGLGLKVVAPEAGYSYSGDVDGEKSVQIYLTARAGSASARAELLAYNEDDCRANRAVREWLARGGTALGQ
ncbi:TM0106 family RecB-like putative nuclease [Staphylococcus chromogenes]|nr:TM0106 family RecB-like putative nuclease [Staphylococcus chromogenes]